MHRVFLLFLFVFLAHELACQSRDDSTELDYDPAYIIDHQYELAIKQLAVLKSVSIQHVDNNSDLGLIYKPNENLNLGFGLSTEWLTINAAFNLPWVNNDDAKLGKTESIDLQTNIYLRKWAVDLAFLYYKGFHLSNPNSTVKAGASDFRIRPDIESLNLASSFLYIFNHKKFSYRAAFNQVEQQIKSSGSWVAGGYLTGFTMRADSTLVPLALQSSVDLSNDHRNVSFYNFGITGGYAYTLALFRNFYITGSLTVGLGPEYQSARSTEYREAYSQWLTDLFMTLRLAAGYNGDKFFAGVTVFGTANGGSDENSSLVRGYNMARLTVGYRFAQPSFVKKLPFFTGP